MNIEYVLWSAIIGLFATNIAFYLLNRSLMKDLDNLKTDFIACKKELNEWRGKAGDRLHRIYQTRKTVNDLKLIIDME